MIENTVILLMCRISSTIKTATLVSDGKTFSQFDFTELLYMSADTDFAGCCVTFLHIYYWQNHQGNKCSTMSPLVLFYSCYEPLRGCKLTLLHYELSIFDWFKIIVS